MNRTGTGLHMHAPATVLSRRGALAALAALAAGACTLPLAGCNDAGTSVSASSKDAPANGSTFAFDTYCSFTVYGDDTALARLSEACAHYDALFNGYDGESDIARINAAAGAPVEVDPACADIIAQALAWCEQADGLFDITIGAVSYLWDFEDGIKPSDDEIAAALTHVDWRGVHVDTKANTVQLDDPAARLDLGGIAKGYVADRLVELLRDETEASAAMISLGGNIALFGEKPDGSPWAIGVRDPNDPGGSTTVGTVYLDREASVVTSGLYERTFELDGITYWHILDPRCGMPVATDTVSDTVVCPSSTTADALSTTLFVAGSARGSEIADAHDDTAAYFLLQDGSAAESTRWQDLTDFDAKA